MPLIKKFCDFPDYPILFRLYCFWCSKAPGRSCIFHSRQNHIFCQFPFWYIFELYIFDRSATVWIKGFGLRLTFYLLKRVSLCSRYGFFYWTFTYFVPIGSMEDRVTKINSMYLNGTLWPFHLSWLINFIFICPSA